MFLFDNLKFITNFIKKKQLNKYLQHLIRIDSNRLMIEIELLSMHLIPLTLPYYYSYLFYSNKDQWFPMIH